MQDKVIFDFMRFILPILWVFVIALLAACITRSCDIDFIKFIMHINTDIDVEDVEIRLNLKDLEIVRDNDYETGDNSDHKCILCLSMITIPVKTKLTCNCTKTRYHCFYCIKNYKNFMSKNNNNYKCFYCKKSIIPIYVINEEYFDYLHNNTGNHLEKED